MNGTEHGSFSADMRFTLLRVIRRHFPGFRYSISVPEVGKGALLMITARAECQGSGLLSAALFLASPACLHRGVMNVLMCT